MKFLMVPHDGNDFSGVSGRAKRSEWRAATGRRVHRVGVGTVRFRKSLPLPTPVWCLSTSVPTVLVVVSQASQVVCFVEHAVRRLLKKKRKAHRDWPFSDAH